MKLKVKQLKDFFKHTSAIKNISTLPTLKYLKFNSGMVSKTNLAIFCSMDIDCDISEPILLDEEKLQLMINKTSSNEISIKQKGNEIIISDGKMHMNHRSEDASLYPTLNAQPKSKGVLVSTPIIEAIQVARSFVSEDNNTTNFRCVHFKDSCVMAVDFHLFYIQEFKWKFPNVILLDEYCDIITQFKSAFFSETEKHYFYDFDSIRFAFTKVEYPTPDVIGRLNQIKAINSESFKISKKELVDFCEVANGLTPSKNVYCSFKYDVELGAILSLQDNDYATGIKNEIYVDGHLEEFSFNSRKCVSAFRALPQDELTCQVVSHTLIVKNVDSYACFQAVAL